MKGTIIDFDEVEKNGLILAEDGNRYSFDLSTWKSKNKNPEIDFEVDFVVNKNIATDVFCLTKSGNAKVGKTIEIVEKPIQNKSYSDIKKIDFEKLENEINNPEAIKNAKSETKKEFLYSILGAGFSWALLFISSSLKWPEFFVFFFLLVAIASIAYIFIQFIHMINPKSWLKKNIIHSKYKDQLKIINYTPNSLEFDSIKVINISDKSLEKANNKLIEEAYNLKADAIINYSHQTSTTSNVRTSGWANNKSIKTDTLTLNIISGLAIKVKE
ncbi:hypothetical protein [Aliarcobacter cryaerophilus]|uniref:hypothetical protein n=1 Tax=Aliarcobacter cryaerophilus TaxID=28198 RepID=UPI003DA4CD77